ncbi:hypothetical protein BGZ67_007238 [Mortierella alpina]|nr:hypothetical protein BGZ67_007238 [Mortierella alpina]
MTTKIIKSKSLVPVRSTSPEFAQYDTCFSKTLVCLYELKFENTTLEKTASEDSSPTLDVATVTSPELDGKWASVQKAPGQDDICWVNNDQDIVPRFLAIVQRH